MRAPGAVHVLRSAQAVRQSWRPCPPPGHVRLHSASCSVQVRRHAAAAGLRVAASARPTSPARTSARCERACELSAAPREASTATLGPRSLTEGFFMPLTCPLSAMSPVWTAGRGSSCVDEAPRGPREAGALYGGTLRVESACAFSAAAYPRNAIDDQSIQGGSVAPCGGGPICFVDRPK